MKKNKGFGLIGILIIIVAALAVGDIAYRVVTNSTPASQNTGVNNYQPQENQNNNVPSVPAQNNQVNNPANNSTTTTVTTTTTTTTPSIKVLSPNGGETYSTGTTNQQIPITWRSSGIVNGNVAIYVKNISNGNEVLNLIAPDNGATNIYGVSAGNYKIGICDTKVQPGNYEVNYIPDCSTASDYSDNSFTVSAKKATSTSDGNLIKLTGCGVSFSKTSNWNVISNTSNETKLDILPNDYTGFSGIDIKCVLGNSITDTDAKFGNITYFYDSNTQKWMVNAPDEQNGGTLPAVAATPLFTVNGWPVFHGTGRWLTYIIPISQSSILYFNEGDTEGGSTQSLKNLVNTLH